jgi:hypothetical protein
VYPFIVALLAVVLVTHAQAQVQIDIGIHLPAPPQLVVIPEVRAVQYVPAAPANLFFYGGQYWAFVNGGWHVSARYNGPWVVIAPIFVPRPVLLVPVSYYRVPPGHWKQWQKHAPPRWDDEWGREWSEKRQWKARGDDGDKGNRKGEGHGKDEDRGKGEARGKDEDRGKGEARGKGEGHGRGKGK